MTNICLRDMNVGDSGKVTGIRQGEKAYRQKLLAMGLTPGTEFRVVRYAPMGDPIEIKLRGFSLSVRQEEANALLVEKV